MSRVLWSCTFGAVFLSAQLTQAAEKEVTWKTVVDPKPISKEVKRGLDWLVKHQLRDGSWGQGEESPSMRHSSTGKDKGNVADTAMALLALLRFGNTPSQGQYRKNIEKGLDFVLGQIEASDKNSLYVTNIRGTRVQSKIGPHVDTFLSSLLLTRVQDRSGSPKLEARVNQALSKVMYKMEKNQKDSGDWGGGGWAGRLSTAIGNQAMSMAETKGYRPSKKAKSRKERYAKRSFDQKSKSFSVEGSAGISLYGTGSGLGALSSASQSAEIEEEKVKKDLKSKDKTVRQEAQKRLDEIRQLKAGAKAARKAAVKRLDDAAFVSGFGSNGGEEFLSYMMIGESLVAKGGNDWSKWDQKMTKNLNRVQNRDGSWTGHHCITGRTFVTSAALMVLMTDRSLMPIAKSIKRG